MSNWNIFSNHGHVLLYLARDPGARLRDVAANVGITERAVQKIVRDMQDAGVVSVSKVGRRNRYAIDAGAVLRHKLEAHCTIGQVMELVLKTPGISPADDQYQGDLQAEPTPVAPAPTAAIPPAAPRAEKPQAPKDRKSRQDQDSSEQGSLF